MQDFAGKTAIVTGAAAGMGLGIARALAREGMNLALADIRADALDSAVREIEALGVQALAIAVDVSDAASVEKAAAAVAQRFGKLHVAVNNAGIALHGTRLEAVELAEWDWVIGVNVYGVIHGIRSFLPLIRRHGEGGHIVNTASIAGFQCRPGLDNGAYAMTKYAVVGLSEQLALELAGSGIGVTVLAPGAVRTSLAASAERRPARLGGPYHRKQHDFLGDVTAGGMAPDEVGAIVVRAIRNDQLFAFTHPELRQSIEDRHRRLMRAFDEAGQS